MRRQPAVCSTLTIRDVITIVALPHEKRVYKSASIKLSILIFNLVLLPERIFFHMHCFLS